MFQSFFMGGFECATGHNRDGAEVDQIRATGHDVHADADYARLRRAGLLAARDGIRWPLVDRGRGRYDFSSVRPQLEAARRHGVDVIWDLFHYGYPDDASPFDDDFVRRFAAYCAACARFVRARSEGTCWFTPMNEPSYFSWAAGEAALFAPHQIGKGPALKRRLVEAAIAGIDAIHAVDPTARIVNADPVCRVVAPPDRPDLQPAVDGFNDVAVFESWDMLAGRLCPELGGSARHLDVVGVNYYWTNQWEWGRAGTPLEPGDPRLLDLAGLVRMVHARYGHPLLVTETAHGGDMRPGWITEVARHCERLVLDDGVPLLGACLYPVLGMPEWHEPEQWTRLGLWDVDETAPDLPRRPHVPSLRALREAQAAEARILAGRFLESA